MTHLILIIDKINLIHSSMIKRLINYQMSRWLISGKPKWDMIERELIAKTISKIRFIKTKPNIVNQTTKGTLNKIWGNHLLTIFWTLFYQTQLLSLKMVHKVTSKN